MLNINKLKNISMKKQCSQSSFSKWSKTNEANRLVNTTLDVDFAIHTQKEENPWWMVNLGENYKIEKIIIRNRKNYQDRARTLKVEVSTDGQKWKVVQQGFQYWGDRKDIPLKQKIEAKFVKISLEEITYLHLSGMGVYTRDYYIVSGRNDGLGGRLQTMLNAMYISKNSNLKFAYIWRTDINEEAKDFIKKQKIDKNEIVGHAIEFEEDLFDKDFIDKFSCTTQVNPSQGILRSKQLKKITEIEDEALERDWGWYAPLDDLTKLFSELDKDHYYRSISKLWTEIGFKNNIRSLIDDANKLALQLPDFIALHIRSGDIVYSGYRYYGKRFMKKALPLHLALGAIEQALKENKNIVLFGDDSSSNHQLKELYDGKVKVIEDFFPDRELSNTERAIFEITFMSQSENIMASGASFFSSLASLIGNIRGVISSYNAIDKNQQYETYKKYLDKHEFNRYQMAFSYFHLFVVASELKKPLSELEQYLKKSMEYDRFNNKYLIFLIDVLLKQNKKDKVEKLIVDRLELEKDLNEENYKSLADTLIIKADKKYWHSFAFKTIKDQNSTPGLSYLSSVIDDNQNQTSTSEMKLQKVLHD